MKTIVEIHVLQNFAPSNLNRDDTGAPKDALFGGTRRARISSQCAKRAVRQFFGEQVAQGLLSAEDLARRSKRVLEALTDILVGKGRDAEAANQKATLALGAMELAVKDEGKTEYLLFLGQREIAGIADVVHEKWDALVASEAPAAEGKKAGKAKKQAAQGIDPEIRKALDKVFNGGKALDVALFGRMLADMPEKNQNAACQVAHALSTHAVEREFDFYTAVDDLKPEDTAGADMMGTVEFNSACFYRYAVVDWEKLGQNLQDDTELAARGLRAFLEGFVVAEPTGKQNTFAAHNPPEFVMITVRRNTAPRNLANAFETAIRARDNLTRNSANALLDKARALQAAYGGETAAFVLDLTGAEVGDVAQPVASLSALLDAVMAEVRRG
ncbi:type I-E CRISPR-associated protein Cas7/Cse4/CasC [Zoogloeaceae bacteirum Par-f-2]|jgi:CRISPR system Cascade subunit CasC|uniref:type I-E CRISPR-associated protein Cas7/Cse4/CasC n=1 Tax=Pseudothauera hydrothermalis TaxID=2184083 RepID=UPI000C7B2C23|nr:type I-E CRISPR-associated protein Cas7/Cse4/CasC [Pseudothauera hydrothermalis]AUM01274.1 type I-E CRISPR-associated protein Cas7/Cse4/CasC [Rhodocyclaceae bacterium]AVZ80425.1 type I-E CRISPR-associated protein Cas7/Cse4/CasC [Zoogloeaceae bacteirum Par-f-2]